MNQFLCFHTSDGKPVAINLAHVEAIAERGEITEICTPGVDGGVYKCPHPISLVMKIIANTGEYRTTYKKQLQIITCQK